MGHGFDAESGLIATVPGIGALFPDPRSGPTSFEHHARLGHTVAEHLTPSAFVTGVPAHRRQPRPPGLDLRWVF